MKKALLSQERRNFFSKIFITGTGSLALLSLSGCSGSDNTSLDSKKVQLTDEQKEMLLYMYQEEKVARDVYYYLGNLYPDENTFAYIQISEQRHMDACRKLCDKYGVDISAVDETEYGVFIVESLQALYDLLIAQGEPLLRDALEVGILIEETDIDDIQAYLDKYEDGVLPKDIVQVFTNLMEGSYNHLEAFEYSLSQLPTP